jgi:adenosylcobinamide-phosphate synthase
MITYHIIAFVTGFFMDLIIGDPYNFPHPIRWIGSFIGWLDRKLLGDKKDLPAGADKAMSSQKQKSVERIKGLLMWVLVVGVTVAVSLFVVSACYSLHFVLGIVVEAILTCYCLAAKSLKDESMKVYKALTTGTIENARKAVSMIVGRDTACLDEKGVTRAVVETIAENTSDGIIAPLIYTFLGGPVLGLMYKAINTMDSMVGYHNDRYEYFGKAAARTDDVANFFPARISAIFMILAALIGGKDYSFKGAIRIFKRDRFNHKSPNSAQTESVCAGALSVRLAGDASYFGKIVKKPFIGDPIREIEADDIKKTCRLMYITEDLCVVSSLIIAVISYLLLHLQYT